MLPPATPPDGPGAPAGRPAVVGLRNRRVWALRCHWCGLLRVTDALWDGVDCRDCGSSCFEVESLPP